MRRLPALTVRVIPDFAASARAVAPPVEPIVLPTPPPPARRPSLPVVAAVVPIGAAVVMWLVTGSALMLLFAALGPLVAIATALDGARTRRRERRRSEAEAAAASERAEHELRARHDDERAALWAVHPDAGRLLQRPADIWRPAPQRGDALVVGAGDGASAARIVGGGDDEDAAALRARAGTLQGVPVGVAMRMGICVVGARVIATAVARALVLQLCLAHAPDRLGVVSAPPGEDWVHALPHRAPGPDAVRLAFTGPGQLVPDDADAVIAVAAVGAPVPLRCGAVLAVTAVDRGRLEHDAQRRILAVESVSRPQAEEVAATLAVRAPAVTAEGPPPVRFGRLAQPSAPPAARDALVACIGRERDGEATVDLVEDGPHAVVAGVTGSGKSELLITWILALCAARPPSEVCFLLADFKGGTAFDVLATLPHVTGVLTDLDGSGARRAMESLRAELRRREAELVRAGARDIRDGGVELPRLVIVVDEFAALLTEHPELHAVFTDVAARGRALGMHLILGTQRITGVVRDALLANCPLRISLRVTDPADSRAVIGSDVAARLPGTAAARGLAYVRRAADASPRLVRIALSTPQDAAEIAGRTDAAQAPRAPWLPALPARIPLDRLLAGADGGIVLGVADEPERQRQPVVQLVIGRDRGLVAIGGAGSGKSTLIDLLSAQAPEAARITSDPETAWDAAKALEQEGLPGRLVLVDDMDALAAVFPPEYSAAFLERLERIARAAGADGSTVVVTAQRLAGPVARIAELLPLRAILPTPSRIDHVAAGGEPGGHDPAAPAGRAVLAGRVVQFALPPQPARHVPAPRAAPPARFTPAGQFTAVVTRQPAARAAAFREGSAAGRVLTLDELVPGIQPEELFGSRTIVVGDADGWQRHWNLLARVRAEHDIVVSTGSGADFRALTGRRELPPYTAPEPDRAWLVPPSGEVTRVLLPGASRAPAR